MANEEMVAGDIAPGLIVRHTNRHLGVLSPAEACGRLISGRISFSEFVDQFGESFTELLDFMMEHDLHPGRPEDVIYCLERETNARRRGLLRAQLEDLYAYCRQHQSEQAG